MIKHFEYNTDTPLASWALRPIEFVVAKDETSVTRTGVVWYDVLVKSTQSSDLIPVAFFATEDNTLTEEDSDTALGLCYMHFKDST